MWKNMSLLRKAQRQKAKLRIGISGPSGSGKTYSALLIAKAIVKGDMSKVAVIDTENGSADLYSHIGEYNVLPLQAPYSPENYIKAITECENAGMEVIIIDSVTHEWDGKGGCLEINELLAKTKFKGNTWGAWSETTPRHQKFIEAITQSKVHVITTARSKTDTMMTEDKKVKKVGLKEIQREGFEYELTLNFTLDRDGHHATASKDRTEMFIDRDPFVITEAIGEELIAWAEQGVEPIAPPKPVDPAIANRKKQIVSLVRAFNPSLPDMKAENFLSELEAAVKRMTQLELKDEHLLEILSRLKILWDEKLEADKANQGEESLV